MLDAIRPITDRLWRLARRLDRHARRSSLAQGALMIGFYVAIYLAVGALIEAVHRLGPVLPDAQAFVGQPRHAPADAGD